MRSVGPLGTLALWNPLLLIEEVEDAVTRRHGVLHDRVLQTQFVEWPEEVVHQLQERDEGSDGDPVRHRIPGLESDAHRVQGQSTPEP